ncbi:adenylylsulfate kinase [Desulfobaculum xiamenense]|uniref:Adenylyl-sulfate kinase n=1 Tax=Desulfobaculum xiamenense TaxID=995050 RepID=A0A846QPC1_9BACT|nr:adenylyl-sulfate kinase [Desulfobaculum xiamenense]NJB69017.1 adenylylsulfate kinase [Desulfobaculum xiamenense]
MSFTLWFTGLSGAGKSTLARNSYFELKSRGLAAELLDGDLIRTNFSSELGFTRRDRDINIRRIGFICHLLNRNGIICVVAAISPYAEARAQNRELLGRYVEVFCRCPLEVAEGRDVKGLYARARKGEIPNFTGISDPYEAPLAPEIVADTANTGINDCLCSVLGWLERNSYIPEADSCPRTSFSLNDEREWRSRLIRLGYAKGLD